MKRILTLVLILSFLTAQAQVDSVEQKLKDYSKHDTVRVEMLIDACVSTTFKSDERLLAWANEALNIARELHYVPGEIRATNCIGNYYYQRALYDRALEYYYDALKLAERTKSTDNIIISKSNVANVLTHTKRLPEAIRLFKECNQLLESGNDSLSQKRAAILTNLATAYSGNDQHDSAVYYYNDVYHICKKRDIGFGLGLTQSNLASEYYALKDYQKALQCCKDAEALIKKYNLGFLEGFNYTVYGKVYLVLGDYKKGIEFIEKGIAANKQNGALANLTDGYKRLHQAFAQKKDFPNAYAALLNYVDMYDSIYNMEKNKVIEELNTKYNTEKKESMITDLQKEKTITELTSQRKSMLLYSIITVIAMAGVIAYFLFARYRYQQENQALMAQIAYEQTLNKSVLKSIKAQMNPHFFYNALNTIQACIFNDDKRLASAYLTKFSNLTRMILEMSEMEKISLTQEVKALTLYLELEQARFIDNFSFVLNVAPSLDTDLINIPAMLVQPYVENAIKHGLLHKKGPRELVVDFYQEANVLKVKVDDNGVGREQSAAINSQRNDKPASFATQANEVRLNILNEGRTNKVGVSFEDKMNGDNQPAGTTVIISIPLYQ